MKQMKTALVLGAGGFIGSWMVKRLKSEGYWVRGVDLKHPEFSRHEADEFVIGDLRDKSFVNRVVEYKGQLGNFFNSIPYKMIEGFDEVYQFAADMGGAGYIFTDEHSADIMHNSATINLNLLDAIVKTKGMGRKVPKIFYSSSACIYPSTIQEDTDNPGLREEYAYPANPDSEYGWEKLFSERLYLAYGRNYNLDIRIARYHNIYGPEGTWDGGKEKAPAAMCRKVASILGDSGEVECWGDGEQTRSFLYIDDCIEATRRLMESNYVEVINIGSEEMVSINELIRKAAKAAGKEITIKHIDGPLGVRGRNSQNDRLRSCLDWDYSISLDEGIARTYQWVKRQVDWDKRSEEIDAMVEQYGSASAEDYDGVFEG
ncbi:UDP-glucose 4-epimerase [Synechococcus phage S-CAM9]|uniref:UDP-glucose 4-epimerase n=1 Tax=Synechococcus phage S-CAM9 TaxID=1883369 RepID=A0A1D8KNX5_9CAUD|nr:nucleotide-sugar epimerase [Synechococcus phage S-CAM9]AOV60324.1 UDP-glucose 4-epimerase [Synechococcus phage S-CAM9]AOV60552.1 UDP-glucose 4-epimerase [Synechococcus phage S-CAM9]AOV60781.1 UDP-glucose 4-epimerase [Synechococcus phage S-CAM9]